jgi:hypothetical protein
MEGFCKFCDSKLASETRKIDNRILDVHAGETAAVAVRNI